MVVEERWRCDAESKRILDDFLVECKEEEERRASYCANTSYDELLLKYLQLKDYLRDCYQEVWKEFIDETEAKVY